MSQLLDKVLKTCAVLSLFRVSVRSDIASISMVYQFIFFMLTQTLQIKFLEMVKLETIPFRCLLLSEFFPSNI